MNDAVRAAPRVFVVEDEPVIALELEDRLRGMGYDVCGYARTAAEALAEIARARPDVVLMDVELGGAMDGVEVTAHLRELVDVPVVFLTAHSDASRVRIALDAGPFAYLVKPFLPEVLRANLEVVLLRHDLERRLKTTNAHLDATATLLRDQAIELQRSHALLHAAFDASADGLLVVDSQGHVTRANAGFFEMWRIPPAMAAEGCAAWSPRIVEQLENGAELAPWGIGAETTSRLESPRNLNLRDGRVFERTVSPLGQVFGRLVTFRDVTDQHLAATHLFSPDAMHLSGEAFFNAISTTLVRLLGLDAAFVAMLMPTGGEARLRTVGRCADGSRADPIEFDLRGSPCEVALGESSVVVVVDNVQESFPHVPWLEQMDATGYAAVALRDRKGRAIGSIGAITRGPLRDPARVASTLRLFAVRTAVELERGGAEARFHELFEFSPDGILMVDAEGIIVLANRRAERLFGYPREELVGLRVEALMPEQEGPKHVGLRRRFFASAEPRLMGARDRPLYARRKDGTTFPVDIGLGPLRTDDGIVVIAAVRDVSDRVEAERARRALEEQLRQSQKMEALGTLAGGIAHDFNNLLTVIVANLELSRTDARGALAEQLADIASAASRATGLVRQILAFSRSELPNSVVMEMGPLVEEVVKLLRTPLPANVTIEACLAEDVPTVFADPAQIHQVLMNLGTNAWHAVGEKVGHIAFTVGGVELGAAEAARLGLAPGPHVRVAVRDDGGGIAPQNLSRIFEPFFTTKAVGRGTGLGLSVVHGIVQESGGAISVDSEPERGTTFTVYLPAASGELTHATAPPASTPASARGRVLFVDDERMVVRVATRILSKLGYAATGFSSAEDAVETFRAEPHAFDVVITDSDMPGMSGLDVARELHRIRPELRIGLISGQPPPPSVDLADVGIAGFLEKPFDSRRLGDFVRDLHVR